MKSTSADTLQTLTNNLGWEDYPGPFNVTILSVLLLEEQKIRLHGEKGCGMEGAGAGMMLQIDTEQAQNPRGTGVTKAAEGNRFLLEPPGGISRSNALVRLGLILTSDRRNRTVEDTRFALGHCGCSNCLQQTWGTNIIQQVKSWLWDSSFLYRTCI